MGDVLTLDQGLGVIYEVIIRTTAHGNCRIKMVLPLPAHAAPFMIGESESLRELYVCD